MSEIKTEIGKASGSESSMKALFQLNRLDYVMPPFLGIMTQRTQLIDRFVSTSYTAGQEMILDAQTGGSLVDGRNSRLEFTVVIGGTTNPELSTWGPSGSCANVIQRIAVYNRNGDELSRTENANLWINQKKLWERDQAYFAQSGQVAGWAGAGVRGSTGDGTAPPLQQINTMSRYSIPLSDISPVFDQEKLLPWQMCQGMRIRITLATNADAFVANNIDNSYTVSDPEIVWDVSTLADQFKRKLDEVSASTGLYLVHKEIHNDQTTADLNMNFQVTKPVSKGLKCHVVERKAGTPAEIAVLDFMSSFAFNYRTVQARLSNLFFPQQVITSTVAQQVRLYHNNLMAWGHLSKMTSPSVMYDIPGTPYSFGHTNDQVTRASWTVDLVKNQIDDLQGYAINSSRTLNLATTGIVGTARRVDVYLQHLQLLTIYSDRAVVKD